MAIPAYLSKKGVTVYPVTIPQAIINPETGEPINLGSDMEYTINNQYADSNGNFTITAESIGAAVSGHTHNISDVANLQETLDTKANASHTHVMVNGVQVDGSTETITGQMVIRGTGNVNVSKTGANTLQISVTPYTTDTVGTMQDANANNTIRNIAVFTGTLAEWNTFSQSGSMTTGKRYLVIIRS